MRGAVGGLRVVESGAPSNDGLEGAAHKGIKGMECGCIQSVGNVVQSHAAIQCIVTGPSVGGATPR